MKRPPGSWIIAIAVATVVLGTLFVMLHSFPENRVRIATAPDLISAYTIDFSPDGNFIATGHSNQVLIWDLKTLKRLKSIKGAYGNNVEWSSDGMTIATSGGPPGEVCLWDGRTGAAIAKLRGHRSWVTDIAFSPDGATMATSSEDGTVRIWDLKTLSSKVVLDTRGGIVNSVTFSSDGTMLATGSEDGYLRLLDTATWHVRHQRSPRDGPVHSVAFSADDKYVASGSGDIQKPGLATVWDARTGMPIRVFRGHRNLVWSVAFSPKEPLLASGGWDNTVRVWDVHAGRVRSVMKQKLSEVYSVTFSPDGAQLAASVGTHTLYPLVMWDVRTGRERFVIRGHEGPLFGLK